MNLALTILFMIMTVFTGCNPVDQNQLTQLGDNVPETTTPATEQQNPVAIEESGFLMAIASDTQLYWKCETQACRAKTDYVNDEVKEGEATNEWQVQSINKLAQKYQDKFKGLIINGDLTAFGHTYQLDAYKSFYEDKISVPVWPGLGNHDYQNNVDDCALNNCAIRMVKYLANTVGQLPGVSRTPGFDFVEEDTEFSFFDGRVKKYHGSLAYSFDVEDVHFVQLNNFPTYTTEFSGMNILKARNEVFTINSSLNWLTTDLSLASAQGKKIIVNMHDAYDAQKSTQLISLLKSYKVSAVFTGHLHTFSGQVGHFGDSDIPVFYSGSSSTTKYLLVNFNKNLATVKEVDSLDGEAKISDDDRTWHFQYKIK